MKMFTELANGPVGPCLAKELYDIVPVISELMWASDDEVGESRMACVLTRMNPSNNDGNRETCIDRTAAIGGVLPGLYFSQLERFEHAAESRDCDGSIPSSVF